MALVGHTKVIQIRQRETLSHQRAIIHENCFSAAQYCERGWIQIVIMLKRARLSTIASPKLLNDLFEQKTLIITTTFHLLKQLIFLTKTVHIWAKLCLILYSQNLKLLNQYCHNLREVVHQSRGCSCKVGMSPSRNFPARAEPSQAGPFQIPS